MAEEKNPTQVPGRGDHSAAEDSTGRKGGGDSGGGAYPNPHSGKKPKDGLLAHGGQTEIAEKKPGGSG